MTIVPVSAPIALDADSRCELSGKRRTSDPAQRVDDNEGQGADGHRDDEQAAEAGDQLQPRSGQKRWACPDRNGWLVGVGGECERSIVYVD